MGLKRLEIENVRCIERARLELGAGRNFLIGPNGSGKTSVLEAIFLLGRGRSFRTRQLHKLVRYGKSGLSVFGSLNSGRGLPGDGGRGGGRVGVGFSGGKLAARINGEPVESLADLAREFVVHVIDPRLHELVEAGPSERRRFIDGGVFHVEPEYLAKWRDYRRLLAQRNAALKGGQSGRLLGIWTEPFIQAAEAVQRYRAAYVTDLGASVRRIGLELLGLELEVELEAGWRRDATFADSLARSEERDRTTGFTQVGPHRADMVIRLGGQPVRDSASRGQQKLAAAALVLGQASEFERRRGTAGTLLVDDPAAELDGGALERLLSEIGRLRSQTVIAGLRLEALGPRPGDSLFHVEQGTVTAVL